ncbi:MAG: cytochrome c [Cyclobacteriaceae bacterium]|jgi:nitric oxide reductase subunit C|nr:cytochrome c [Cyclobacteriaceae bacterium]
MTERTKILMYGVLLLGYGLYSGYIYRHEIDVEDKNTTSAMEGKKIWQQKNCTACHQIYGLGGFLGPDLTNIYSATGKGPAYIKAFVRGGTNVMPSFEMSEGELDYLIAFLKNVDASGKADPKNFKLNLNGTIESQ